MTKRPGSAAGYRKPRALTARLLLLPFCVALALAAGRAARAESAVEFFAEVGAWEIFHNGEKDYCATRRPFDDGTDFVYFLFSDGGSAIVLSNEEWSFGERGEALLDLFFDDRVVEDVEVVFEDDSVTIDLGASKAAFTAFRQAYSFGVIADGERYSLSMQGSARALAAVKQCVASGGRPAQSAPSSAPSAASPAAASIFESLPATPSQAYAREDEDPAGPVQPASLRVGAAEEGSAELPEEWEVQAILDDLVFAAADERAEFFAAGQLSVLPLAGGLLGWRLEGLESEGVIRFRPFAEEQRPAPAAAFALERESLKSTCRSLEALDDPRESEGEHYRVASQLFLCERDEQTLNLSLILLSFPAFQAALLHATGDWGQFAALRELHLRLSGLLEGGA